ncbi:acyl-CoA dehydrogenase family protein [Streptomyces melanosporofaciens]|uniref:Acyl-CoA dehydrogenase n=1 Tax=Streptomyces melanosporofaciens TaxID=67327 RepID=A0A1H4KMB8_STRMJ|nr:acyl-CoA dehydrogenase family protein [Streptomyces melanosporofaciens]SEB59627.1 Acyl-CoA dehydrogenase [Streptomyces melanosporofaciens]
MSVDLHKLRERMRAFINEEVIPAEKVLGIASPDATATLKALQARAKELGLWALGHPAHLRGGGLPLYDFALINEIIGRSEYGQAAVGTNSMQDSIMLDLYASPAQRERWLKPMVNGDIRPSVGLTEPEVAGSDPTRIRTTAVLDGDQWVINGHKWFTSNANVAAFTTVFARTEGEEATPHRAISAIIVPAGTPGLEISRVVKTMGSTQGNHCELQLRDVRVPADHLLGERGAGFTIAQRRLGPGRIFHCMRWLGQAQRAFELMVERANSRYAHGSLLAEKGEIRRYIAESAAEIQASRLMTLDAARRYDQDGRALVEISMVKFWGARVLHNVIDRAIQVHGALGVTEDTPLESMYRHARYARIYDGPDEVHRMVVARKLLADLDAAPWAGLPA